MLNQLFKTNNTNLNLLDKRFCVNCFQCWGEIKLEALYVFLKIVLLVYGLKIYIQKKFINYLCK